MTVRTDAIRVRTVNDLMLIRLHDLESANGTTLRQTGGRIILNDGSNRLSVRLIPSSVQVTGCRAPVRFVLCRVIVFGQQHRIAGVNAVGESATELLIRHDDAVVLFVALFRK
jgi:hypothetical protein